MAAPRLSAALAFCVTLGGCGGPSGPLALRWRFADGRRCADTGVANVQIGGPVTCTCGDAGTTCGCQFTCWEGEAQESAKPVSVTLTRGGTLTADALSPVGGVLYRGTLEVDSLEPAVIDLYFTGGR